MGPAPAPWSSSIQVEERQLQEYMCQKQHTLTLEGASQVLQSTLVSMPTTITDDGCVHFGDSLMLRSACTQGLLQADSVAEVDTYTDARGTVSGLLLTTGSMLTACPRNVFTISRVNDNDGFGKGSGDTTVYYGQIIRLGTGTALRDRPYYLSATSNSLNDPKSPSSSQVCVYPRASAITQWKVIRGDLNKKKKQCLEAAKRSGIGGAMLLEASKTAEEPPKETGPAPVQLGDAIRLESVCGNCHLQSDGKVVMTSYGNEWRVYGAVGEVPPQAKLSLDDFTPAFGPSNEWSFVDSRWAQEKMEAARIAVKVQEPGARDSDGSALDGGRMLADPLYAARRELKKLSDQGGGAKRYSVLERIYPILKNTGMHVVRRLRRMCKDADEEGTGRLSQACFLGFLTWVGIRLFNDEVIQIREIFGVDRQGQKLPEGFEEDGTSCIDYNRFFKLMGTSMPAYRVNVVKDAYTKLQDCAVGRIVDVSHLQRHLRSHCFPEVQLQRQTESEAREEFMRQWDMSRSDGIVDFEEFLDYYQDVSISVYEDNLFIELVRSSWDL
eukprot:TRINITY_DN32028_c0_g1_i1.p1 TRINITY_DN32028_c0_g1~~TRINITY_DN32028_c0_g1_i1.p1  ORF type:complete len:553 (+),score=89.34 TRINITY_DN32028_c0_g1_i1:100-1758(+)